MTTPNYQDKYARFHDKPCINGEPSSNNGWIYTAYMNKLQNISPDDYTKLYNCFNNGCASDVGSWYKLLRSPGKELPPFSRDEVLGAASLKLLQKYHLNGWNFSPFLLPKFNLFTLVKQLWQLRPTIGNALDAGTGRGGYFIIYKHRNYFWQNNLDQLYRFAFSVPLTDRHFLLTTWGKFSWYNPMHVLYWTIAKVDSKLGKASGIRFLKYGKSAKAMAEEFPADHPIVKAVNE